MLLFPCGMWRKAFGSLQVLKGVDLDVFKGRKRGCPGRSGSGKSVADQDHCRIAVA